MSLLSTYNDSNKFEIGVDECARGPMFGRLYTAAVVLPKDDSFHHDWMKDSKKIKSKKKMRELSDYIKQNATAWCIQYVDAIMVIIPGSQLYGLSKAEQEARLLVLHKQGFTPLSPKKGSV